MQAPRSLLAAVAAVGLIGAGAALRPGTGILHAAPAGIPTDGTIADVAERTVDSVVNIQVQVQQPGFDFGNDPFFNDPQDLMQQFGQPHMQTGKGSGVIVTASGRILTNAHVVDNAADIKVTLQNGTELAATVVGKDTDADLAVIQLKGNFPQLRPIQFGDSSSLRLGDIVLAVGDGMGVGKSVSMGIVSAKVHSDESGDDYIQTDAAINPGNSGGALVNLKGELVGINKMIATPNGGSVGIGFAIPTNTARPIMEALLKDGKVARGYMGVTLGTVTPEVAEQFKLGAKHGAGIGSIEQTGPAAQSGLREGDVVVAMDGTEIKTGEAMRRAVAKTKPGTIVALKVVHKDGITQELKVKLGERPDLQAQQQLRPQGMQRQQQMQGGQPQVRTYHYQWP